MTPEPQSSLQGLGSDVAVDGQGPLAGAGDTSAAASNATPFTSAPDVRPGVALRTVALAAAAPNLAVGWLLAGLFAGVPSRTAIMALALVGVLVPAVAGRFRSGVMRVLAPALPLAMLVAAANSAASSGLPRAVRDAIGSGQLAQPPVGFGAGWQLVVGGLLICLGAASVNLALATASPRLAVLVPMPVIAGLTLIQPPGHELLAIVPAVVLLLAGLALAQGGELEREIVGPSETEGVDEGGADDASPTGLTGAAARGFETRRLVRAGLLIAVVVGLLAVLTSTTNVLPTNPAETTLPPLPPPTAAPVRGDEPLFTVRASRPVALRLGVLDRYQDSQWLTPPLDPAKRQSLGNGSLADDVPPADQVLSATVTVQRPDTGRFLPLVPGTYQVKDLPNQTVRTSGGLELPVAAERGLTYTLRFQSLSDEQLAALKLTPVSPALALPPPPPQVQALLNQAPPPTDLLARVRFMRGSLFDAAQESKPAPPAAVTPERVDEILGGSPASPFELGAAEALITGWAGADVRLGYGYLQRDTDANGVFQIGASSGATWTEVRTLDGAWVALTDRPHQRSDATPPEQKTVVLPNGERIAQLAVPVQVESPGFLYTLVRYWAERYALALLGVVILWLGLPGLLRGVRRLRRRRWADRHGPAEQIAVAYAQLRDKAIDLGIGEATMTPLEFLDALTPDEDHVELGWLVDRALFGDLRGHLDEHDVEAAQRLSSHLTSRMAQGQSYLQRVVAFGSHASLREPWTSEIPNGYPRKVRWMRVRAWSRLQLGLAGLLVLATLVGLPMAVGIDQVDVTNGRSAIALPHVPEQVEDLTYQPIGGVQKAFADRRSQALIADTDAFIVRRGSAAIGTLQTATLKAGLAERNLEVRSGLLKSLGMTAVQRVGSDIFYTRRLGSLSVALWFTRDGQGYQVLTMADNVKDPLVVFAKLVATQRGLDPAEVAAIVPVTPSDVREWSYR